LGADAAIAQDISVLGDVHIDSAQVRSHGGRHHLFNAIEQASKFVFVQMGSQGGATAAADFLIALIQRNPCRIRRVFTLDAAPFVSPGRESPFSRACRKSGIEHCLAADPDPWTRSSGSRMGDMLQDVTFTSEAYLVRLLGQFVHAYDFRRRLKTLRGKTPHEFFCQAWSERPDLFLRDPHHELLGLEFAHG
jgi:transposase-like protein